jgi:hypothetical protein
MIDKDFVFSRIGMALVSTQRVEYVAAQLISHLKEFDEDVYGITGPQFLAKSKKANLARATLGKVFTLLKLAPKLVIEEELNEYVSKRNLLVHGFWQNYLDSYSVDQAKRAVDFCYDFGRQSEKLESFFKGFIFFLGLRHVENIDKIDEELKSWKNDFDYFMLALHNRRLQSKANPST